MNKQDIALASAVPVGIAVCAAVAASKLGVKLTSAPLVGNKPQKQSATVLETMGGPKQWNSVHDIIVVGSGASGLMAGVSALWTKPASKVVVLEKSKDTVGGTTAKSGGVFWLPNNVEMTVQDDRASTIQLIIRHGYPQDFNLNSPTLGISEDDYSRVCQYYDVSRGLSQQLKDISYRLNRVRDSNNDFLYDYQYSPASQPENVAPQQRHLGVGMPTWHVVVLRLLKKLVWLTPVLPHQLQELNVLETMGINLEHGLGIHLVAVLQQEFEKLGGVIRMNSAVDALVLDDSAVVGVRVNENEFIGAHRGVVFASGGFAQNPAKLQANLPFLQKSGAAPGNKGDFIDICEKLDADLVNMDKIWGCEVVYDAQADESNWETKTCLFQMRGDSFFVVGPEGKRVYNEKSKYDLRARAHWEKIDAGSCASNEQGVFFLIGDHACVSRFVSEHLANTWPALGDEAYICASTIEQLGKAIQQKFPQFVHNELFTKQLPETMERFNQFAESGVDLDFARGTQHPSDAQWTTGRSTKNKAMFPLDQKGPFYALPIVTSVIDTKGGPRVDVAHRVLRKDGTIVDRLFAAGNCAQSVTGDAYLSGGATLGAALVSGYVAGMQCMLRGEGGAKL